MSAVRYEGESQWFVRRRVGDGCWLVSLVIGQRGTVHSAHHASCIMAHGRNVWWIE
jgi:hypothetical protein